MSSRTRTGIHAQSEIVWFLDCGSRPAMTTPRQEMRILADVIPDSNRDPRSERDRLVPGLRVKARNDNSQARDENLSGCHPGLDPGSTLRARSFGSWIAGQGPQ